MQCAWHLMNSLTPESSPVSLWENEFQEAPNVSLSSKFCHGEYVISYYWHSHNVQSINHYVQKYIISKSRRLNEWMAPWKLLHKKTQPPLTVVLYLRPGHSLGKKDLSDRVKPSDIKGGRIFLCNGFHGAVCLFKHRDLCC